MERGTLPWPERLPCVSWGQPAAQYHHHRGYAPEYRLDVVPMCPACHGQAHGAGWRGPQRHPAGEAHANARPTAARVIEMRARYDAGGVTQRQLAAE